MDRGQTWHFLEKSLTRLVSCLSGQLDVADRDILTEFMENREFGVALEWLHSLTISRNLLLSERQKAEVRRLAEMMKNDLSQK